MAAAARSAAAASTAPAAPLNVVPPTPGAAAPRDLLHSDLSTCKARQRRRQVSRQRATAEVRLGLTLLRKRACETAVGTTSSRVRSSSTSNTCGAEQPQSAIRAKRPAPHACSLALALRSTRTSSRSSRPPRRVSSSSSARTAACGARVSARRGGAHSKRQNGRAATPKRGRSATSARADPRAQHEARHAARQRALRRRQLAVRHAANPSLASARLAPAEAASLEPLRSARHGLGSAAARARMSYAVRHELDNVLYAAFWHHTESFAHQLSDASGLLPD